MSFFCVEGVHVSQEIQEDGDLRKQWTVIGPCDGSCQTELKPEVERLVVAFKKTGKARSWNQLKAEKKGKA